MRSNTGWQQQGACLVFEGCWTHERVAQVWHQMPSTGILVVDASRVNRMDSAFLTLIVRLSPLDRPLIIQGAPASMLSLLHLYNLTSLFEIAQEVRS